MKIGNLEIKGYASLAPMAGVADRAMREICIGFGAAYTVSELVSAKGPRQDPAGLCLVVQRPQDRHGRADEVPGLPGPAGQLCWHADRLPFLPELCPSRLLPPHYVQPHRQLGRKRRVSQHRIQPEEDCGRHLLQQRKALLRSVIYFAKTQQRGSSASPLFVRVVQTFTVAKIFETRHRRGGFLTLPEQLRNLDCSHYTETLSLISFREG